MIIWQLDRNEYFGDTRWYPRISIERHTPEIPGGCIEITVWWMKWGYSIMWYRA